MEMDLYDIVINIRSMNSLLKDGWEMFWANEEKQQIHEKSKDTLNFSIW